MVDLDQYLRQSTRESDRPAGGPYRFFFFSSDRGEPVHVHVTRERKAVEVLVGAGPLEYNRGFASTELNRVTALVREHEAEIVKAWHEVLQVRSLKRQLHVRSV